MAINIGYRRLSALVGKAKAVTATAQKIAVLFYNTLRHGMEYGDPGASHYEERYRRHVISNLERRAKSLGTSYRQRPRENFLGRPSFLIPLRNFRFTPPPHRRWHGGERFRAGERISSSRAESTVNAGISKRFAKRQKMQWTKHGVHLALQTRTRALDGIRPLFEKWSPGLANDNSVEVAQAVAA